ncbi:hypothetical protein [Rhizobium sp.]
MLHLDSFPIDATQTPTLPTQNAAIPEDAHVVSPDTVDLALPRDTVEQICVPASINGRDLSQGQP